MVVVLVELMEAYAGAGPGGVETTSLITPAGANTGSGGGGGSGYDPQLTGGGGRGGSGIVLIAYPT